MEGGKRRGGRERQEELDARQPTASRMEKRSKCRSVLSLASTCSVSLSVPRVSLWEREKGRRRRVREVGSESRLKTCGYCSAHFLAPFSRVGNAASLASLSSIVSENYELLSILRSAVHLRLLMTVSPFPAPSSPSVPHPLSSSSRVERSMPACLSVCACEGICCHILCHPCARVLAHCGTRLSLSLSLSLLQILILQSSQRGRDLLSGCCNSGCALVSERE